jgi:curli biogenesis system outer membrane secretion channel CsgG
MSINKRYLALLGGVAAVAVSLAGNVSAQIGKPVIGILRMDDEAAGANPRRAAELSTMIETAITETGKFHVIERDSLNKIMDEQTRGNSGLVTTNTPGKVGGFEGVDYLVYGTITTLGATTKADIGANFMNSLLTQRGRYGAPMTSANCSNTYVTLGLDIKITDAHTGEVKYVNHLNETQKSATACGHVAQVDGAALFRTASEKIASGLVTSIYPIQVAAVQPDGQIVLNYGDGVVQVGEFVALFTKGTPIKDPSTGEVIANDETQLGYARIVSVSGRISRAVPASPMSAPPPVGTIARPAKAEDVQVAEKGQRH